MYTAHVPHRLRPAVASQSEMTEFAETWGVTWEVIKTIPRAKTCVVEETDKTFKSGRKIIDCVFFDANKRELQRRSGMRLVSKKGNKYCVCKREPELAGGGNATAV